MGYEVDAEAVNLALLVLRIAVGLTMVAHGYNHAWGGGKIDGTAGWFESMGLRPGRLHAWAATVNELVCGTLLVLGLLTPFACAGVIAVMVMAFTMDHRKRGFFIFKPGQGWEYVMNLAVVCLALAAIGPGELSLDDALDVDMFGWTGMAIAVVLGVGSAAGTLAAFWRPAPADAS